MPIYANPRMPDATKLHRTRYEVRVNTPTDSWIAGYLTRVNRQTLLGVLRQYADDILELIQDTDPVTYRAGVSLALGPVCAIVTGRTERDAYWEAQRNA